MTGIRFGDSSLHCLAPFISVTAPNFLQLNSPYPTPTFRLSLLPSLLHRCSRVYNKLLSLSVRLPDCLLPSTIPSLPLSILASLSLSLTQQSTTTDFSISKEFFLSLSFFFFLASLILFREFSSLFLRKSLLHQMLLNATFLQHDIFLSLLHTLSLSSRSTRYG